MAATCQERGITHVKDVFNAKKGMSCQRDSDQDNTENFFFGFNMQSKPNPPGQNTNNNNKPGGFLIRSGKNKDINIMEIPVPTPKYNGTNKSSDNGGKKDTYLSPKAVQKGRDSSNSPKKSPAPLPPPIATPPPPPPPLAFAGVPSPPPSSPPPPPPTVCPPPPPKTSPPPPPPVSPTSPVSPGYTHIITADVHHTMEASDNASFEHQYLSTSPISRQLSGDYQAGSLFNGMDDDGDILNNLDTSIFSSGSIPRSPQSHTDSGISEYRSSNKIISDSTSPVSKKNNERNNRLNSSSCDNKRNSVNDAETESSLLTGSEHGAASSGYYSEFSTDSDRPISPAFKSPTTINESSSSFEEDECTLDFDDDGFVENNHKKVYHEYQGEDFSKYLQDDDYSTSTTTLTRRVQKHKQRQPRNAMSPNRRYAAQVQKKPGFKDRISQAFTLTKSDKRHYGTTPPPSKAKIHNFSFMNSKMGMYASEEELREYVSKDLETKSDIGGVKKAAEVPSWYKDTLSASTLRRAKDMLDKRSLSTSVPNLTEAESYRTMPNAQNGHNRGESLSDFGVDAVHKKKVNRFKFWKGLGKKGKKNKELSSQNVAPQCVDIRL